jgi:hypothetical protein
MATKSATKSKTASKSATASKAKSPRTKLSIAEVKEPKADTSSATLRANKGKVEVTETVEKAPKAAKAPKTPKEAVGPAIEIISALYGIEGTRVEMASVKAGRKLTNKMAGSDPAPKTAKDAIITAKVDGTEVTVTVKEGELITFA